MSESPDNSQFHRSMSCISVCKVLLPIGTYLSLVQKNERLFTSSVLIRSTSCPKSSSILQIKKQAHFLKKTPTLIMIYDEGISDLIIGNRIITAYSRWNHRVLKRVINHETIWSKSITKGCKNSSGSCKPTPKSYAINSTC